MLKVLKIVSSNFLVSVSSIPEGGPNKLGEVFGVRS